ncbi:MAG: UDP-glucose/GDP-mannose dehydrogenase family protein [Flavobacteriales bacterium]|nr:UDP-glucose/GDP-mannose dehydrogenase family protein [Flavobacteriales bacterium]
MKIAVIGTGYVGLVTGVCLAETGNQVVCVDKDPHKLAQLRQGQIPIYEPGLEPIFRRVTSQGRLIFSENLEEAAARSELIFLALPTPEQEDGSADLCRVLAVTEILARLKDRRRLIITKSTVPVGTAARMKKLLEAEGSPAIVVSNPEFLREGFAIEDFMKPTRIVVGTSHPEAREIMARLYQPFVRQGNPIYFMSEESAELAKYAANAFLAMKISFMNELARLAEKCGANIDDVRLSMGADDRIGKRFLFAGLGYGGSCFPKDVKALAHTARSYGLTLALTEATLQVNDSQLEFFKNKIRQRFDGEIQGKTFAVWGLAFKPDTDDVREAPALKLIRWMLREGARIQAFDPEAFGNAWKEIPELPKINDMYAALEGADALVICTEWTQFRTPDFEKIAAALTRKIIFDGRNLYPPDQMRQLGFEYFSVGRL